MADIELEDRQLAAIAERAQKRLGAVRSSSSPADPLARALEGLGMRITESSDPPRSPSTPPSSDMGARGRALLQKARETIPERFRWARFDSPTLARCVRLTPAEIARVRGYAAEPPHSLLLVGGTGAGKTTLACAMVNEIVDLGLEAHGRRVEASKTMASGSAPFPPGGLERYRRAVHCRFVHAYELATAHANSPLGEEPAIVTKARRASVLLLDDLGMDTSHKRSSCVRDLLHERDAHARPTVITTYLTTKDIESHYGAGIMRRLREGAVLNLASRKLSR